MTAPPITIQDRFATLLRQIPLAINGSTLPIYEFDQAKVEAPRVPINPFQENPSGNLAFNAWRLAHAIKKADCARWQSSQVLWAETAGFCLEYARLLNWGAGRLCLNKGMSSHLADFSSSSLAGRIAQGMALLFLENEGYSYVGHFESEWRRHAATQNKSWPKNKRTSPDFIVENKKRNGC